MSVHLVAQLVQASTGAASWSLPLAQAITSAILGIGRECLINLLRCNLAFCAYGAVAGVMTLKACIALRARKPEHAQDHTLHALAASILAIVHLLG